MTVTAPSIKDQTTSASFANAVSGVYTVQLIDKLFGTQQPAEKMNDLYYAIVALFDTQRIEEAMHLIRGLYTIANLEYPYQIELMECNPQAQEVYVVEFICDFFDIIDEKMVVEEDSELIE